MSNLMTQRDGFDAMQKVIGEWGDRTFGKSTVKSVLKHFEKEVKELLVSKKPVEAADCVLLLIHFAHKKKFSLYDEIVKKFEINRKRKWGKPDKDGVVEHVR